MAVVDGAGIPISVMLASAQEAEVRLAETVVDGIRVQRKRGRPRRRPECIVADRGYDSRGFRRALRSRSIRPCIPYQSNRKPRRGPKPDLTGYASRWLVERTFAWLGNFRRLVVRWERSVRSYAAFLFIACIVISLRTISG